MKNNKILVAGCGRMGLGMVRALYAAGFNAKGFDILPRPSFTHMSTLVEAKAHAEILLTVVRDTAQTEALLFTDQALLGPGTMVKTLIICSTLSPNDLKSIAARAPAHITLVDAPMSGAQIAADEARLSFMLGGPERALDRLQPLFDAMGTRQHRMGAFGAGMAAKVLNNFVAASSVAATRWSLAQAEKLGLDQAKLLALMNDSSGQTWFGSHFDQIEFARDGYDADNTIGIIKKDVVAALDAAGDGPLGQAIIEAIAGLKPV